MPCLCLMLPMPPYSKHDPYNGTVFTGLVSSTHPFQAQRQCSPIHPHHSCTPPATQAQSRAERRPHALAHEQASHHRQPCPRVGTTTANVSPSTSSPSPAGHQQSSNTHHYSPQDTTQPSPSYQADCSPTEESQATATHSYSNRHWPAEAPVVGSLSLSLHSRVTCSHTSQERGSLPMSNEDEGATLRSLKTPLQTDSCPHQHQHQVNLRSPLEETSMIQ